MPELRVAWVGGDFEAVVDFFIAEDVEGLLEAVGAGAGEAEGEDGHGACAGALGGAWGRGAVKVGEDGVDEGVGCHFQILVVY